PPAPPFSQLRTTKVPAAGIGSTNASRAAKHQNVDPPAEAPPKRRTATTTRAGVARGAATEPGDGFRFGPGPLLGGGPAITDSPGMADAINGALQILQRTFLPTRLSATVDLVLHWGLGHWIVAIVVLLRRLAAPLAHLRLLTMAARAAL